MPATIRTVLHAVLAVTIATAALSFSGEAWAISQSCKGKGRADRSATDAFFKDFVPHYTMGECMVRLKLDFHEGVKQASVVYQMGKEFRRHLYANAPTAAAYYFEPGRDGFHYMMYVNECPTRYAITQAMIDAVQPCFAGEVDIKMIEGPIKAGPQTFEPSTMEWTDSIPE